MTRINAAMPAMTSILPGLNPLTEFCEKSAKAEKKDENQYI
jgi:hypothetical protein